MKIIATTVKLESFSLNASIMSNTAPISIICSIIYYKDMDIISIHQVIKDCYLFIYVVIWVFK